MYLIHFISNINHGAIQKVFHKTKHEALNNIKIQISNAQNVLSSRGVPSFIVIASIWPPCVVWRLSMEETCFCRGLSMNPDFYIGWASVPGYPRKHTHYAPAAYIRSRSASELLPDSKRPSFLASRRFATGYPGTDANELSGMEATCFCTCDRASFLGGAKRHGDL